MTGRTIENVGFSVALFVVALYALGEFVHHVGYRIGPCAAEVDSFPWGTFFLATICILPKTIGRATAGAIWGKLAGGVRPSKDDN